MMACGGNDVSGIKSRLVQNHIKVVLAAGALPKKCVT